MMQAHDRVSIEENQKSFACEICWRRFARETDLKTHVWIHTQSQEKGFSCDLCHRAFPCATTLNSHFKRTHKDVTLSPQPVVSSPLPISTPPPSQIQSQSIHQVRCPQQQQQLSVPSSQQLSIPTSQELSISTSQQLPVSPDSVTRKNSPPCGVCGKKFAFKYYVKIHQTVHTKEKPYICDLCHKTFSQASSRNRHRKEMHKEDSDVQQNGGGLQLGVSDSSENKVVSQFDVLGKQYPSNRGALYEVHPVPDTKEKPYICDLCHKRFTQASSRNRHLKEMHKDGDTPLPPGESPPGTRRAVGVLTRNVGPSCQVCSKRFPCKSLLEIHMRVHTKERPYSCEICYKTFTQVSSRNFHRRKMHKDLILSLLPPQSQQQEQQEQQQQLALKQTTLVESGGKLVPECGVCGKRFPCKSLMEIHMRVHTKERPYSCDLCFKTFTQVSSRNFHRRKIHKEQIASPNSQTSSSSQSSLPQPLALGVCLPKAPSTPRLHQPPSSQLTDCHQKQLMQSTQLAQHQEQPDQLSQQQQNHLAQQQQSQLSQQQQSQLSQQQQSQLSQQQQSQLSQQQQSQLSQQQQSQLSQQQQSQLSQQQQSQLSQQQQSQLTQLQMQSQLVQQSQQQHQTQNPQLSQQLSQQQLNKQQNLMSPLTQQSQLQPCQLSHQQQHRQSPLSPQRQSPSSQQPQLSPSPTIAQQQANLHQHSRSHVLHQVQAETPSQTGQSLLVDAENKNFHCKMCASSSFNYK